jgi:tetratricopeptide (TPR) repeat protein
LSPTKDFYAVLSVPRTSSPDQIRARFLELARERHPDRFQGRDRERAEADFLEITEAFNVLSNPHLRRQLDLELVRPQAESDTDQSRLLRFHLEAGSGFYRDGNFFSAAESFERAVRIDPRNHQGWQGLAQSLSRQRKFLQRALEASERACALEPMNATYLKLAGRLHAEAGLLDKAERYYNEANTWGGEDPVVLKALEELRSRSRKGRGPLFGRGT